jgi:ubiquinone/menaquinone biosynthesis C-methylase UbiE
MPAGHIHHEEWKTRANDFRKLLQHLRKTGKPKLNILDLGCGNGWMSARLHDEGHTMTGVDLNMEELGQAERVFGTDESLQWIYGDVFGDEFPTAPYDVIILGASCQYFPDISQLTSRLLGLLQATGEIHLYDSVFYPSSQVGEARKRSEDYYKKLGFPEMSSFYFHHSEEELRQNGYKKVRRGLFERKSPLSWWVLTASERGFANL